jgi:uncharacterized protein YbjT (DUF2867 family)
MTTTKQTKPTLVLGGTGKTGRRVATRLRALGHPVCIGSRRGEPPFDWEDPGTWAPALDGAGAIYLSYYPDLAAPGAVDTVGAFARLAVDRGIPRIVLISGRGEAGAEHTEEVVRDSGAALTVVRSAWFAQNFSEDYLRDDVVLGEVAVPAGDTPEPFVDAEDIAEVAVAALTDDRHVGELYEVTGPRLLTFADAVAEIAAAMGRDIRYLPVSIDQYGATARAAGASGEVVELLTYLFGEVLDGRNAHVADGVSRALGRPPKDFASFARDAAAAGEWDLAVTATPG